EPLAEIGADKGAVDRLSQHGLARLVERNGHRLVADVTRTERARRPHRVVAAVDHGPTPIPPERQEAQNPAFRFQVVAMHAGRDLIEAFLHVDQKQDRRAHAASVVARASGLMRSGGVASSVSRRIASLSGTTWLC